MKQTRLPKGEYFSKRLRMALESGDTQKAEYFQSRLTQIANTPKPENKFEVINDYINTELENMNRRSIVATPESKEHLESFSKANNGSNDFLLMQMSIQFGYKMALENTFRSIESLK